jgi:hypothetical protein
MKYQSDWQFLIHPILTADYISSRSIERRLVVISMHPITNVT